MKCKTTGELSHEIKSATDLEDYLARNRRHMELPGLTEHLCALLSRKGISRAAVVRGSLLDRSYVYQIFSGAKIPSRDKLIALSFGLGLSGEEAQALLKLSGNRELYARDPRDALILFALQRRRTIFEANELLACHSLGTLGAPSK